MDFESVRAALELGVRLGFPDFVFKVEYYSLCYEIETLLLPFSLHPASPCPPLPPPPQSCELGLAAILVQNSFTSRFLDLHGSLLAIRVDKPFSNPATLSSANQEHLPCRSQTIHLSSAVPVSNRHFLRGAGLRSGQSLHPYRLSTRASQLEELSLFLGRLHAQRDGQHLVSSSRLGLRSFGARGGRARSSVEVARG